METPEQYAVYLEKDRARLVSQDDDGRTTVILEERGDEDDSRIMKAKLANEKCSIYEKIIYVVLIMFFFKPSKEYSNIYRYMAEPPGSLAKITSCAGERFRPVVFLSLNGADAFLKLVVTWLWFHFQVAHIAFISLMVMIATYNGATFYLHPFIKKGLSSDPYIVCGRD